MVKTPVLCELSDVLMGVMKLPTGGKVAKKSNSIYLLDKNHAQFFKLMEKSQSLKELYSLLRSKMNLKCTNDIVDDLLDVMNNYESSSASLEDSQEKRILRRLNLLIAQTCTMECIYCYGNKGKYTKESLMDLHVLHKILVTFSKIYWKIEDINFFGGEPLLNLKSIEYTLNYFQQLINEGKINSHPTYVIVTGLGVSENVVDKLVTIIQEWRKKGVVFTITVSIDGPAMIQNITRPLKGHKPSFDLVDKNIKKLRKIGQPDAFEVTYTRLHQNMKIYPEDIILFIAKRYKLENESIFIVPVITQNNSLKVDDKKEVSSEPWLTFMEQEDLYAHPYIKRQLLTITKRILNAAPNEFFCDAGISNFTVTTDGDIYVCQMLVGNNNFKIGNIFDNNETLIKKLFENVHRFSRVFSKSYYDTCKKCPLEYICSQCPAANFLMKNIFVDFRYCESKREFFKKLLDYFVKAKEGF